MAVSVCDSYAYSYLAFCINILRRIFQCGIFCRKTTQPVPVSQLARGDRRKTRAGARAMWEMERVFPDGHDIQLGHLHVTVSFSLEML